ncbi:hypothetical protein [Amycolatopsis sp. 195334CR]|uniref:hypothetical protein n=1 Tax=Amycolatopsis sp. 195334CR TaxID=2814588 RepID=UPI001A8C80DD|nr:hypothetical protein [Amycolatopsis sp. 195334CR]MBN6040361.1 hypothetical protein [Amycolatopsis sp. 195334CR]
MTDTTPRKFTDLGLTTPSVWSETIAVHGSQERILATGSPSDAARQIALEQLGVLHSIRRILMWVLIIIPALAIGLAIVFGAISASSDSGSYSTRCTSIYC